MLTRPSLPRIVSLLGGFAAVVFALDPSPAAAAVTVRWLTLSDASWPDSAKKVIAGFEGGVAGNSS
jgi:hypothetical protein